MDAALYHPEFGYYARAVQRSGRAGDFFTSVDVGPLFGELLARQIGEMHEILNSEFRIQNFDLVEAGAGNGRLSADILRALKRDAPESYVATRVHLVEASEAARATHAQTLAEVADRLASSSPALPDSFEGVLIANELLDAMPVHQVVMRENGLREVYVESRGDDLGLCEGPLSTPRLAGYFAALGTALEPGWRAEVSLAAVDWTREAARRLRRGFVILIDYGHEASELYSVTHSTGTLTTFSSHRSSGPESAVTPWLRNPGQQDLTAHVDFTSIRNAAEAEGCTTLGFLDQMYFLLALVSAPQPTLAGGALPPSRDALRGTSQGVPRLETLTVKERLALKTLVVPGGLGSTMKVMVFGKGVGAPKLTALSSHVRVT
ncbi:MAG TPA: SAM-dependent methyltransferase [Vicinamibacterales bacterium]